MTTLNQDPMKAKPDFSPTPRRSVQRALARVWRLLLAPEALYHGITGTECSPGLNRNQMPKLYHFLTEWLQDGLMLPFCCLMWGLGSYCRIKEGVVKQQNVVYFCRYKWNRCIQNTIYWTSESLFLKWKLIVATQAGVLLFKHGNESNQAMWGR